MYRMIIVCLFLLTALAQHAIAQTAGRNPDMQQKVQLYRTLLEQNKARGADTRRAEQLNQLSRQAAIGSDQAEAAKLLDQAITLLKSQNSSTRAESTSTTTVPANNRIPAQNREFPPDRKAPGSLNRPANPPSMIGNPTVRQPVFILPFTHHYNGPGGYYASAGEVRQIGEFFVRHHIPGTLFFDGILVERLQKEDPTLLEQVRTWNLPLGYHGEETHGPYPVASDLFAEVYPLREAQGFRGTWSLTSGKSWDIAVQLVKDRYSYALPHSIDESSRMLNRHNESATDISHMGGLKLVQHLLGKDVSMMPSHGLESAPEGYAFRRMSRFGFDQPAVPIALHALRIFRVAEAAENVMQIAGPNESVFWYMGRIMSKGDQNGEAGWHLDPFRRSLSTLDRTHPRLILMGFSKVTDEEGAATVRYLTNEFFPANPGSCWVSGETITNYFEPEKAWRPTQNELIALAHTLHNNWAGRPPDLIAVGNRTISLCDAFEALARAVTVINQTGALPDSITLHPLYGPITENGDALLVIPTSFSQSIIAQAADTIIKDWERQNPDRFIPARVRIGTTPVNCAEMLFAMASTCIQWSKHSTNAITVTAAQIFPPYADTLENVFKPKTTQPLCYTKGQLWTVKPTRLRVNTENSTPVTTTPGAASNITAEAGEKASQTNRLLIVFAANLDSAGPCYRDQHDGADLYQTVFNLSTRTPESIKRLTSRPDQAEWFPTLSPDRRAVIYDEETRPYRGPARHDLRTLIRKTGKDTLCMRDARWAAFAADGHSLFYSRQGPERAIMQAALSAEMQSSTPTLIADSRFGPVLIEDPAPLPTGKGLVFHRKASDERGAGVAMINLDRTGFQELTPPDGSGHATVSPAGDLVACSRSQDGRVILIPFRNGAWSTPQSLPLSTDPADFLKFEARFGAVREVRHSYLEFVTPDLLLLTSHGADNAKAFRFARLFLLHLRGLDQPPEIIDLSGPIEAAYGKTGRDFCSATGAWVQE